MNGRTVDETSSRLAPFGAISVMGRPDLGGLGLHEADSKAEVDRVDLWIEDSKPRR
jgi:hypothetical protein